jgi:hypothetical protein
MTSQDQSSSTVVSFDALVDSVSDAASAYQDALNNLQDSASSDSINMVSATVATTNVQVSQSLTEMASGIAKNAADYVKGLGRKVSG